MSYHGEYKVPGGKLVVIDFTIADQCFADVHLSGDFFLEPDTTLDHINKAVTGLSATSTIASIAQAVKDALPTGAVLLGITPEAVGIAVRRALTGAAQWRDYEWEIVHEKPVSPRLNAALDEVLTIEVGRGTRKPTLRIWEWDEPGVFIGSFQSLKNGSRGGR